MNAQRGHKSYKVQGGFSLLEVGISLAVMAAAVFIGMSVMLSFNKGMSRAEARFNITSLHEGIVKSARSPANTIILGDYIETSVPQLKLCLEQRGIACNTLNSLSPATSLLSNLGGTEHFNRIGTECNVGEAGCFGEQALSLVPQCSSSNSCDSVKLVLNTQYIGESGNFQFQSSVNYEPFSFGWLRVAGSCPPGKTLMGYDRSTGKSICVTHPGSKCEEIGWYSPVPGMDAINCQHIAQAPQSIDRGIGEPTSLSVVGYRRINSALLPPVISNFEGGIVQSCVNVIFGYAYMSAGSSVSRNLQCPGNSKFQYRKNNPHYWGGTWGYAPAWSGSEIPLNGPWGHASSVNYNLYYGGLWGNINAALTDDCCVNTGESIILSAIRTDSIRRYYKFNIVTRELEKSESRNISKKDSNGYDVDIVDNNGTLLYSFKKNMTETEFLSSDISFKMSKLGDPTVFKSTADTNHATQARHIGSGEFEIKNFIKIDPTFVHDSSTLVVGYSLRMDNSSNAKLSFFNSSCNLSESSLSFRRDDWAGISSKYKIDISFVAASGGESYFDLGGLNCMDNGDAKSLRKHIVFDLLSRTVIQSAHVESDLNNWGYDIDLRGESGTILHTISGNYSSQEEFFNTATTVNSERTADLSTLEATGLNAESPSSVSLTGDRNYSIFNYVFLSSLGTQAADPTLATAYQYEVQPDGTVKFYFKNNTGTLVLASSTLTKDTWVKLKTNFLIRVINN